MQSQSKLNLMNVSSGLCGIEQQQNTNLTSSIAMSSRLIINGLLLNTLSNSQKLNGKLSNSQNSTQINSLRLQQQQQQINSGDSSSISSSSSSPSSNTSSPTDNMHASSNTITNSSSASSSSSSAATRYKTELCRSFQENGTCKYGEKCQFAHGMHELRSMIRHPKYKTEMCRTFHASGYCPYGPRCHFVHDTSLEVYQQNQQNAAKQSANTTQSSSSTSANSGFQSPKQLAVTLNLPLNQQQLGNSILPGNSSSQLSLKLSGSSTSSVVSSSTSTSPSVLFDNENLLASIQLKCGATGANLNVNSVASNNPINNGLMGPSHKELDLASDNGLNKTIVNSLLMCAKSNSNMSTATSSISERIAGECKNVDIQDAIFKLNPIAESFVAGILNPPGLNSTAHVQISKQAPMSVHAQLLMHKSGVSGASGASGNIRKKSTSSTVSSTSTYLGVDSCGNSGTGSGSSSTNISPPSSRSLSPDALSSGCSSASSLNTEFTFPSINSLAGSNTLMMDCFSDLTVTASESSNSTKIGLDTTSANEQLCNLNMYNNGNNEEYFANATLLNKSDELIGKFKQMSLTHPYRVPTDLPVRYDEDDDSSAEIVNQIINNINSTQDYFDQQPAHQYVISLPYQHCVTSNLKL
jgi:hypothetical protein